LRLQLHSTYSSALGMLRARRPIPAIPIADFQLTFVPRFRKHR
jgi:hypothetical protein